MIVRAMTRAAVVCLLLAIHATTCIAAGPAATFRFDGTWRITRIVGYSDVSISPEALHRLIGQTVTIGPGQLRIGTDNCVPDAVNVRTRATAPLLFEYYRTRPRDAGVAARTLVLDAGLCGAVFRAGADIVVTEGGAFYRAVRVGATRKGS